MEGRVIITPSHEMRDAVTLRRTTAALEQPVTLQEIRQQLGITLVDDTSRDAVISTRIMSATAWAEHHTRRAFITQGWTLYSDRFYPVINLKSDLQTVVSVNYTDSAGNLQLLPSENYIVDTVNSRLYPAYNKPFPTVNQSVNGIQIDHISGYGDSTKVPQEIKEAIKFIVGHWENYQSSIEGAERISTIPYAVTQLLAFHVDMRNWF